MNMLDIILAFKIRLFKTKTVHSWKTAGFNLSLIKTLAGLPMDGEPGPA